MNIFWFEYEFGFMGFFFLMYGFMGFMCLLVCSSDLMKLGVLIEVMLFVRFDEDNFFFFGSWNFEFCVFRICLVLGINHIKWLGERVVKLKCFILYESVDMVDNDISKFQISITL